MMADSYSNPLMYTVDKRRQQTQSSQGATQIVSILIESRLALERSINSVHTGKEAKAISVTHFRSPCHAIICQDWSDNVKLVFKHLDFPSLIFQNREVCNNADGLRKVTEALLYLFKYATNLLTTVDSTNWRVISYDNSVYRTKVKFLKGHQDVLLLLGYTKNMTYGLSFSDPSLHPDTIKVTQVAADLAIAYFEVKLNLTRSHPLPERMVQFVLGSPPVAGYLPAVHQRDPLVVGSSGTRTFQSLPGYAQQKPSSPSDLEMGYQLPLLYPGSVSSRDEEQFPHEGKTFKENQNEMNLEFLTPPSSPTNLKPEVELKTCVLCKNNPGNMQCEVCSQARCENCDTQWHKHPARRSHTRHKIFGKPPAAVNGTSPLPSGAQDITSHHQVNNAAAGAASYSRVSPEVTSPEVTSPHGLVGRLQSTSSDQPPPLNWDSGYRTFVGISQRSQLEDDKNLHHNVVDCPIQHELDSNVQPDSIACLGENFSSEEYDVRAPPHDKYARPVASSAGRPKASASTTPLPQFGGQKQQYLQLSTPLPVGAPADSGEDSASAKAAQLRTSLEERINMIRAQDLSVMEEVHSLRELIARESDNSRRQELVHAEAKKWEEHLALQRQQESWEDQLAAAMGQQNPRRGVFQEPQAFPLGSEQARRTRPQHAATTTQSTLEKVMHSATTSPQAPSTDSDDGWTCEHCTFINADMNTNICSVCHKTSSRMPRNPQVIKPKEETQQVSGGTKEKQVLTTQPAREVSGAEYFQQLEAEMIAEKRLAKERYENQGEPAQAESAKTEGKSKSSPLTDLDLTMVAEALSYSDRLMQLGLKLGFSRREVDKFSWSDAQGRSSRGTFEMLRMWRDRVPRSNQRRQLYQALEDCQLQYVIEQLLYDAQEAAAQREKNRSPIVNEIPEKRGQQKDHQNKAKAAASEPRNSGDGGANGSSGAISDRMLWEVAARIPRGKLFEIGMKLGLRMAMVDRFHRQHEVSRDSKGAFEMLMFWKQTVRPDEQRRRLCEILEDAGLAGAAAVFKEHQQQVTPGVPGQAELSEEVLLHSVADRIPADVVPMLGLYLGFDEDRIDRYLQDNRYGVRRLLLDWKSKTQGQDQIGELGKILEELGVPNFLEDQAERRDTTASSAKELLSPTGRTALDIQPDLSLPSLRGSGPSSPRCDSITDLSRGSSYGELSYINDETKKVYEDMCTESLQRVAMLREAETRNIPVERVLCATALMRRDEEGTDPLEWIQFHWPEHVEAIADEATKELREHLQVDVDERIIGVVRVSHVAAERCLDSCGVNLDNLQDAVRECVQRSKEKILEIMEMGHYSTKDIVAILETEEVGGDVELAVDALQAEMMSQFTDRIWTKSDSNEDEFFQKIIKNDERSIRMVMVEYQMRSWGRAQTAVKLTQQTRHELADIVLAAEECGDFQRSKEFLEQECALCTADLPRNKLMTLIHCQCMLCSECVTQHFEIIARDKSIMKGRCPACDQPDLDNPAVAADYFQFLDMLLRDMLSEEVLALFQRKLRDWNLMQDPYFCWCAHCNSGFINGAPERRKMRCPECNRLTCFKCKKQWLEQHEGISCEAFQQWKENNDPDMQARGLAAHLNENGIECPRCKMRYELAKGGCMHFKCPQCTFEFCCGCNQAMKKGESCMKFASCSRKGLHAHHPRDCLFYMRDLDVGHLKKLLERHHVEFNTEPPEGADTNADNLCGVMEQKENPNGLEDAKCGRKVSPGNAGLCRLHYKEYLVGLINAKSIDPAFVYNIEELKTALGREEIVAPQQQDGETNENYRSRLLRELQTKVPLMPKAGRGR